MSKPVAYSSFKNTRTPHVGMQSVSRQSMRTCVQTVMPGVQVGMPGSVPDKVRQKIIAPLQALPNMLEVCGSDSNYLPQVGAHRNKRAALYCDAHLNHSRQMRHMAAGQAVRLKSCRPCMC